MTTAIKKHCDEFEQLKKDKDYLERLISSMKVDSNRLVSPCGVCKSSMDFMASCPNNDSPYDVCEFKLGDNY